MVAGSNHGLSTMQLIHRSRLEQIRKEAATVAGVALKIIQTMDQVLEVGGTASIQPQMSYLTGALARITKDWGLVEYLQQLQGVAQRKPAQTR